MSRSLKKAFVQNRMQAQLNRLYGSTARTAGNINAGVSLLRGFSSAANIQAGKILTDNQSRIILIYKTNCTNEVWLMKVPTFNRQNCQDNWHWCKATFSTSKSWCFIASSTSNCKAW